MIPAVRPEVADSVRAPAGVILPILSAWDSVNQRLASLPNAMASDWLFWGIGNSVISDSSRNSSNCSAIGRHPIAGKTQRVSKSPPGQTDRARECVRETCYNPPYVKNRSRRMTGPDQPIQAVYKLLEFDGSASSILVRASEHTARPPTYAQPSCASSDKSYGAHRRPQGVSKKKAPPGVLSHTARPP